MNLNKDERKFKEAWALNKEKNKIWDEIHKIKPIKLDRPIHHGYIKYLDFYQDVKNRNDFSRIKEALELCGTVNVWCRNRDFVGKKGEILSPGIRKIVDPVFSRFISNERLLQTLEKIDRLKKYFVHVNDRYACNCYSGEYESRHFVPHYEFRHPEWLEKKVKENWLTHYTPKDGELEERLEEINQAFKDRKYHKLLWKRYPDDYHSEWPEMKSDSHGYYHSWPKPVHFYET